MQYSDQYLAQLAAEVLKCVPDPSRHGTATITLKEGVYKVVVKYPTVKS
jgi:hypothetical protein